MKPPPKLRVRDFMTPKPVVFAPGTDLMEAARTLINRKISGAPVVDEKGTLVGVLTERDFLQAVLVAGYHGERGGHVGDYMTAEVEAVNVDDTLVDVAKRFIDSKYRRFPVVDGNRIVGLVARRDVLKAILDTGGFS
jgi:CBS domain-containing protein